MKGKGKKRSYKELLDENKELRKVNNELKEQLCKCTKPASEEVNPVIPSVVVKGSVVSAADLHNL